MLRLVLAASCGFLAIGALVAPARAFTTPFTFHCTGDACRAVAFGDEGNGCTVLTNHSRYPVRVTQGTNQLDYVLQARRDQGAAEPGAMLRLLRRRRDRQLRQVTGALGA